MGANFLAAVAALALQTSQQDTATTSITHGFGFERISDLFQYNRVQGLSFGLGYRVNGPVAQPIGVYGTVRYGVSDDRVTGRLTVLRDAPKARLALSGYSDVADLDPFSPGRTLANTFNGLIAGHDNADYALAEGGSAGLEITVGMGLELVAAAKVERQRSLDRVAQSELNDFLGGTGIFPPNPAVAEGTFAGATVRLTRFGAVRWNITADLLGGEGQTTGRLFGEAGRTLGSDLRLTVRVKAGAATEPALPQSLFRLGGLHTIRGFEYATRRAPVFWAAQLDLTAFRGRVRPVVFLDAGQASRMSGLFSSSALVGGGAGISLFKGLVRFDLSRPISPDLDGKVRFDLVIQGVR